MLAQQLQRSLVLILVQLIGILDPQLRLVRHQIESGIGDIDGAIKGLNAPLVGLAIGQSLGFEYHGPGVGGLGEDLGVVHQDVGAPLVGHAVVLAVYRVPGGILQTGIHLAPAGDARQIEGLHLATGDETQTGISRGGHQIEAPFIHQGDHLVRCSGGLDRHLAAGSLLETGHPVVVLVGFAPLHVAGPGDDVDLSLPFLRCVQRQGRCQQSETECGQSHGDLLLQ